MRKKVSGTSRTSGSDRWEGGGGGSLEDPRIYEALVEGLLENLQIGLKGRSSENGETSGSQKPKLLMLHASSAVLLPSPYAGSGGGC